MNEPYPWTKSHDEKIRRAYESYQKGCVAKLAREFGVTGGAIRLRGIRIGANVPRRPPGGRKNWWNRDEERILKRTMHMTTPKIIAALARAGFERNAIAIRSHIHVMRLRGEIETLDAVLEDRDEYTPAMIADGLGMSHRSIRMWIDKGWLPGRKCGKAGSRDRHAVRRKDLRRFLIDHVAHWDHAKADRYWLVDLLAAENAKHDNKGKAA